MPHRLIAPSALVPSSDAEGAFSGGVAFIASGLTTLPEAGEPLAVA